MKLNIISIFLTEIFMVFKLTSWFMNLAWNINDQNNQKREQSWKYYNNIIK